MSDPMPFGYTSYEQFANESIKGDLLESLAMVSADCAHVQPGAEVLRAEMREFIAKQWVHHKVKAYEVAARCSAGRYHAVFETSYVVHRDEFVLLLPDELHRLYNRGEIVIWWNPAEPHKHEVVLNFEQKRQECIRKRAEEAAAELSLLLVRSDSY